MYTHGCGCCWSRVEWSGIELKVMGVWFGLVWWDGVSGTGFVWRVIG